MMSSSFKTYGKVNPLDQEYLEARRRTRKRIIIITLSAIVLVTIIVGAVVGTSMQSNSNSKSNSTTSSNTAAQSIKAVCNVTLYPNTCYTSLSQAINSSSGQLDPQKLFNVSIQVALQELSTASKHFSKDILDGITNANISVQVLQNCRDVLTLAIDYLNTTLSSSQQVTLIQVVDDVKTWLSAAGTYQQTCLEGFENATDSVKTTVSDYLKNSTKFTSNSLAIITGLSNVANSFKLRRLLTHDELPASWLKSQDRKLLQTSNAARPKPDAIVAQDGSGKYRTISAALNAVPDKSAKRFVIYVKKGVYYENVRVEKPKWNVMMYGDGKDATIVSAKLNVVDGTPTFSTATFAVFGKGFIGRDMAFRNSAGPNKHQAVALMSSADESVFYRCRIDAYQDSLYTHALRQFYGECDIYGTVDFIFGNAAVVLQNCNIYPRVPMKGQQNTITAQGKVDPNQNTGIVIQNSTIAPLGDLLSVKTYLGRPWKDYSTTLYIQCMMGSLIDSAGWLPWVGNSAPNTIFYSEYQNYGPGSSTKYRVKWKGLKSISATVANKFTVKPFISGDQWITGTGVTYKSGL